METADKKDLFGYHCINEVERLRLVNIFANKILDEKSLTSSKQHPNSAKEQICSGSIPDSYLTSNWKTENIFLKDNHLKYVSDYLKKTDKLIEQTKELKMAVAPSTYEIVSSIEELRSDKLSNHGCTSSKNKEISNNYELESKSAIKLEDEDIRLKTHRGDYKSDYEDEIEIFSKNKSFVLHTNEEKSRKNLPEKTLCSVINMETDNSYQAKVCTNEFVDPTRHQTTSEELKNKIFKTSSYEDTLIAQIPKLHLDDLSEDISLFDDNKSIIDYPLNRPNLPVDTLFSRKQPEQFESKQNRIQDKSCAFPAVIVSSQTSHTTFNCSIHSVNSETDKVVNSSVNQPKSLKPQRKSLKSQQNRNQSSLIENQLCEVDEKKYEVVEPMLCMPTEMWFHIFSYLSLVDLCHISQTCSKFFEIATDRSLWRCVSIENKRLSNELLEFLGQRQPVDIRFSNCDSTKVTNIGMRKLFRGCKHSLNKLTITDCKGTIFKGDNILLYVSCHCPNIKSLSVPWSSLGNDGVTALVSATVCLKEICLNGNSLITDRSFSRLVDHHFLHLTCVEIEGCFNVSSQAILSLTKQARNLTKLNIGLCSKVTHDYCLKICSQLENLNYLDVHGVTAIDDSCLKIIAAKCSKLQTLIFGNCIEITDVGIKYIASHLCKIEHLDVSNCSKVGDKSIMKLISTNLGYLDLSSTSVSNCSIDWLSQSSFFKSINILKLSYCRNITFISLMKMVQSCTNLQNLHLYGVKHVKVPDLLKINSSLIVEK